MSRHTAILAGSSFLEQLVNWYQNSVLYELLTYFQERYFHLEFGAYEHISIGGATANTIQTIIWGIALGLIVAATVTAYTRTKYGSFIRKLIRYGCLSPEHAKTLKELEEFQNSSIRRALLRSPILKKYVVRVMPKSTFYSDLSRSEAEEAYKREENPTLIERIKKRRQGAADFTIARFYLPEDLKDQAEIRFERKGSGWIVVLVTVLLSVVGASLICQFLPSFVGLLDNLIAMMAPQG